MAHNIDMSNDRANFAFSGSRSNVWHKLGQEMQDGQSMDQWIESAGLNWTAEKVPAFALVNDKHVRLDGKFFISRTDTGAILCDNTVSKVYQIHQPAEIANWFDRYVKVDSRFKMSAMGSLGIGQTIWGTAQFQEDITVAGDKHIMFLLMTTTFDLSGATVNKGTTIRVVCNNTLDAAMGNKDCTVKTRHNTSFDADKVSKELSTIAQSFQQYKAMGDALAMVDMSREQVSQFFKQLLDIPFDAKQDDVSTRKLNQFDQLSQAWKTTHNEGANGAWGALQSVTRYIDHERSIKKGDESVDTARFVSAQFGSGALLKQKAVGLLLPLIKDKVLA